MNKTLSSVDLAALVSEFQILGRAKLQQIYHPSKTEFCLHFHVPGKGKQYMRIIAGKMINFASEKRSTLKPSGLCMLLRKHITGAIVEKVWQKDSERIIIFDFIRGELKFHLVVELFSKGNVVLCDESWKILALQSWQLRESRSVKMKAHYQFPPEQFNWKTCSEKEFTSLVQQSEKKNLATTIATELSVGGVFAEELCLRASVDGKSIAKDLALSDVKKLFVSLESLRQEINEAKGYVYEKDISAISLSIAKVGQLLETKESISLALDLVNPLVKVSPYEKKIAKVGNIISRQEETISEMKQKVVDDSRRGELVYEKYADIAKLQDIITSMLKTKEWSEVKKELLLQKNIISVDLKKKCVVLDL